ncbi:hypothetical protein SAMN04488567_3475 [Limimaricola pyoseonensis]|uniref:Uncharacterized protein n=2 Tax=Limimaricola pyoseonensis TaxID=521013 RepID=A0A1G7IJ49_9RHOB|nr:hypothetical protein SAMN04488567_3475 [Limimaricola pyoseonensis]
MLEPRIQDHFIADERYTELVERLMALGLPPARREEVVALLGGLGEVWPRSARPQLSGERDGSNSPTIHDLVMPLFDDIEEEDRVQR